MVNFIDAFWAFRAKQQAQNRRGWVGRVGQGEEVGNERADKGPSPRTTVPARCVMGTAQTKCEEYVCVCWEGGLFV